MFFLCSSCWVQAQPAEAVPEWVDVGDFGSEEPVLREDFPEAGVLHWSLDGFQRSSGQHWENYSFRSAKSQRPGRYEVRFTYSLLRAGLGVQLRLLDQTWKRQLAYTSGAKTLRLGYVTLPTADQELGLLMISALDDDHSFQPMELQLIPAAPEAESEIPLQSSAATELSVAKAIFWSEKNTHSPTALLLTQPEELVEWTLRQSGPTTHYKIQVRYRSPQKSATFRLQCGAQVLEAPMPTAAESALADLGVLEFAPGPPHYLSVGLTAAAAGFEVHALILEPVK